MSVKDEIFEKIMDDCAGAELEVDDMLILVHAVLDRQLETIHLLVALGEMPKQIADVAIGHIRDAKEHVLKAKGELK